MGCPRTIPVGVYAGWGPTQWLEGAAVGGWDPVHSQDEVGSGETAGFPVTPARAGREGKARFCAALLTYLPISREGGSTAPHRKGRL